MHNSFGHQAVKVEGGKYVESFVYRLSDGAKLLKLPVDARELVATGEYSYAPPVQSAKPPQIEVDAAQVPEEIASEPDAPRRGRPRKN